MEYLIRKRRSGPEFGVTAHYWTGDDTVCQLWSKRKMRPHRFVVMDHIPDSVVRTCVNCKNGKPFSMHPARSVQ